MAFSYKIKPNAGDSHQMAPFWLAAFIPFSYRDTYNRNPAHPGSLDELQGQPNAAVSEKPMIVVDSDCIVWNTSTSKDSHISSCGLTIEFTDTDYRTVIAPEDWMFFWAFDNYADYTDLKDRLTSTTKQRVNRFNDGLKFIGRVQSVIRDLIRNPQSGLHQVAFDVQGAGFTEFDSTIYYNEAIARKYPSLLALMADFGTAANEFIVNGSIDANDAIPKLFRICLGLGPGASTKALATTDMQASPNDTFLVPPTVAKMLLSDNDAQAKPVGVTYADLVKQFIGVQQFTGSAFLDLDEEDASQVSPDAAVWRGFIPDYSMPVSNRTYLSPKLLTGDFLPLTLQFNKVSVWSLLKTYLNEPINEMYTCLRIDESGHVVPTLVCRQIPFSSNEYINAGNIATSYLTLPRWEIDQALILQERTGRSNAQRFNYCQVLGISPLEGATAGNQQINAVNNPPIVDDADVRRAGLRMYTAQAGAKVIPTQFSNDENPGSTWSKLMADMLFGSHLKYSGTVLLKGVQAPICEGDNCVIDGVIYHIERIQHSGSIGADGRKDFTTTLSLSNGISTESNDDFVVYPDLTTTATLDNSIPIVGTTSSAPLGTSKQ